MADSMEAMVLEVHGWPCWSYFAISHWFQSAAKYNMERQKGSSAEPFRNAPYTFLLYRNITNTEDIA